MRVLFFTIILFFAACIKPHPVELPPHQPKLVVHAYIETGKLFELALGRTISNNEPVPTDEETYVKNATVVLYENGVIKDTLKYDAAAFRYKSATVAAVSGNTYKIVVQAQGYPAVEATTIAPSHVNTVSVLQVRNARMGGNGESLDDVVIRFTDPANEKNYYLGELHSAYTTYWGHTPGFCVYSYDPVVEHYQQGLDPFEDISCIFNDELLFTDLSFNGVQKEIIVSGSSEMLKQIPDIGRVHKPFFKKYNITEDFYKYIKTGISLDLLQNNPFGQPSVTIGNIRNGYGLFTVYTVDADTLQ